MLSLLVLSLGGAFAQNIEAISGQSKYSISQINEIQNKFQNNYQHQYNISNSDLVVENDKIFLQVREQKRFLFWNVESLDEYEIDEEGIILKTRHNFWSRLLNRNMMN